MSASDGVRSRSCALGSAIFDPLERLIRDAMSGHADNIFDFKPSRMKRNYSEKYTWKLGCVFFFGRTTLLSQHVRGGNSQVLEADLCTEVELNAKICCVIGVGERRREKQRYNIGVLIEA
jgi:hypothetical protein